MIAPRALALRVAQTGKLTLNANAETVIMFTIPKEMQTGTFRSYRNPRPEEREPLADGQRCGLCATTDANEYRACEREICFPAPIPADASAFKTPRSLVPAFAFAARLRAKALSLDWDNDNERDALLKEARALELGDRHEVEDRDL